MKKEGIDKINELEDLRTEKIKKRMKGNPVSFKIKIKEIARTKNRIREINESRNNN